MSASLEIARLRRELDEARAECERLRKDNADLLAMLKAAQLRQDQNLRINCNHD